jgi:ubiquinone/menaquinone biosynthesis C-methylase UbiE
VLASCFLIDTEEAASWTDLIRQCLEPNPMLTEHRLIKDPQNMEVTSERVSLGKSLALVENEHLARYRFAEQFVAGKDVADIACGTGYGSLILARAGAKSVHGMDVSPETVEYCIENSNAPNVNFTTANAQDLSGIPDSTFDVVVSFETIEHLPSMEAYLDEMLRILRPGGTFLVSTPDRRIGSVLYWLFRRPQNHFHVRELSERELLKVLSRRFQIEHRFGQAFVSRIFVFWPVQVAFKVFCRLIGSPKLFKFRDNLYSNGGRVEVIPADGASGIPKFWVILCKKPLKA